MNFIKSLQKLTQNKRIFIYAFMFFIAVYLFKDTTFAADSAASSSNTDFQQLKNTVGTWGNGILGGLSMILALFMYLSTIFLSPAWINGSLFGLNGYFKDIWIMVSNLVYFVFAFILIWIAFMNIIGRSSDQYQLKQALPKFIVGVLIVPFSWFLVQFILSMSAVLTVASLSLPFDTFDTYHKALDGVTVPTNCTLDLRSKSERTTGAAGQTNEGFFYCKEGGLGLNELGGNANAIDSIFGVIAMYNYGILGLDRTDGIDKIDMDLVQNMGDLVVKIVFDLLFVFVYSILMIAIGVVLMVRGIYIWIYIMISPVFGLMYFFDKKDGGGDGFFAKFNVKEFIALAMVPVYTMLALSFGLLFLFIVGTGMTSSGTQSQSGGGVSVANNKVEVGKFTLNIEGQVSKMENSTNLLKKIGNDTLGIVGSLILKVFGIVILWGAVMAALRTSEITKTITQPLQEFGAKVGQIMTSAPGNLPLFNGQSMNSMNTVAGNVGNYINSKQLDKASKFTKDNLPFIDSGSVDRNMNSNKIGDKVRKLSGDGPSRELKNEYVKALSIYKDDPEKMRTDTGFKNAMEEIAKKLKVETKDFDFNNLDSIAKTVVGKIEEALDKDSSIGGAASGLQSNSGILGEQWLKDTLSGLDNSSTNDNNSSTNNDNFTVDYSTKDNTIPIRIKLNGYDINLESKDKVADSGLDNFAKGINGMNKTTLNEQFSKKSLKFDDLFSKAQDKLGKDAIDFDTDGNVIIDLSKKK